MPPALDLGHIIGPVATATVLNVFAFALLWRWDRVEVRTGSPTWQVWVAIPAYLLPIVTFAYLMQGRPITTAWQVFGAAMGGEMMGGGIVYGLLNAFLWSRGQPIRERIAPMIGCLVLFLGMAATLFY